MVLKLYFDLLSQPSRSIFIFLKKVNLPFEPCLVDLAKRQHLKEEFSKTVSRIPRVPVIHDGDFVLNESVAIVRYLSRQYPISDQWYPKDSKKQAQTDEYLEWHHLNLRLNCATYFITKWANPLLRGTEPTEEQLKKTKKYMERSLKDFENYFLSNGTFIHGDKVSYSDIHAACEIEQIKIAGYDIKDHYPKIKQWIDNVRKECNPYYDEAHKFVYKLAKSNEEEGGENPKSKL
ncbi:glutathione S-transferase theta-1 [Diorhabda sublineata]|uniref:glutathione S-transferase theta-1 n=1 Tax=Diorhabda sublineata TaxID=1163346 RepID=UPI0024E0FA62|nr:glutathione S-transferase theta-1 [Diorhabda sublineata]